MEISCELLVNLQINLIFYIFKIIYRENVLNSEDRDKIPYDVIYITVNWFNYIGTSQYFASLIFS